MLHSGISIGLLLACIIFIFKTNTSYFGLVFSWYWVLRSIVEFLNILDTSMIGVDYDPTLFANTTFQCLIVLRFLMLFIVAPLCALGNEYLIKRIQNS